MKEVQDDRYEACFELYRKYAGRNLRRIEREMRAHGFTDFHRRILYNRNERGVHKPGWIEKYGWPEHLAAGNAGSHPGNAGVPACMSAKHERPLATPTAQHNHKPTPPKTGGVAGEGACVPSANPTARNPHSAVRNPQFEAWLKQVSPELTWDWAYQKYIYKYLQRITDGTCKRLMIFMPPRHGKSELVTVRYAGWRLWNDPKMRVIVSSYNQKLADRFSRGIRKLLSEEEDKQSAASSPPYEGGVAAPAFQGADGVVLSRRRKTQHVSGTASHQSAIRNPKSAIERIFPRTRTINTASQWETALGGGVKAVGVGAGVTGFGGQLIVIDDPVKSRAEAESETYRERLWDWYRNDLFTRLEPDAAVILIQTRWHHDDLAGRLLQEMQTGGDQWEVIDLPALSEPKAVATGLFSTAETPRRGEKGDDLVGKSNAVLSENLLKPSKPRRLRLSAVKNPSDPLNRPYGAALCPDRFDEAKLKDIQRQLGSYNFAALYQQHPTPAEGGIFKRTWFTRFVDRAPEGLKWKRGYDLAVSIKTNSCYTASFRVARDERTGDLYIADGFRERIEYPDQKRFIIDRLTAEHDTEHGIEKAIHGLALIQDLRRESLVFGRNLRGIDVTADKVTRALAWAPLAEEGKVVLVRGNWNRAFLDELANFPAGRHDDQIDAVSLAFSMLAIKGRKAWSF